LVTSCESDLTPSRQRVSKGGWAEVHSLARGQNGRVLCRWCAIEVPRGRRTFCSADCVHEWKLRTDAGYLREQVFARDHGVCAVCGISTESLRKEFRKLDYRARRQFLKEWKLKEDWRRSLWDADHVVPVAEGGGECDLANMRTLCLKCHRAATAELRKRLATKS
jgi:5-methylcytosine-specific restriction protein A